MHPSLTAQDSIQSSDLESESEGREIERLKGLIDEKTKQEHLLQRREAYHKDELARANTTVSQ